MEVNLKGMLTHEQIWGAIDALALRADLSPSGLAKVAGLDSTAFNQSKRKTPDGKERWPSTETIAKILHATGCTLGDFVLLISSTGPDGPNYIQPMPFIGIDQMGHQGFFDDGGQPIKERWEQLRFPNVNDESAYALEVCGEEMEPYYRDGDILVISPNAEIRRRDRVLVKMTDGPLVVKVLERKTIQNIELRDFSIEAEKEIFPISDIEWMARVLWASQ